MTRIALCLALALVIFQPALSVAQDAGRGEKIFKKCKACHQVGAKAKNRSGPVLNGVVGRSAASVEGFKYSKAMANSGLVWTEDNLTEYLRKPRKFLKGTRMAFAGLKKDQDIADVIAYLATFPKTQN